MDTLYMDTHYTFYNSTKHAIISVKEYIILVLPEYRNSE